MDSPNLRWVPGYHAICPKYSADGDLQSVITNLIQSKTSTLEILILHGEFSQQYGAIWRHDDTYETELESTPILHRDMKPAKVFLNFSSMSAPIIVYITAANTNKTSYADTCGSLHTGTLTSHCGLEEDAAVEPPVGTFSYYPPECRVAKINPGSNLSAGYEGVKNTIAMRGQPEPWTVYFACSDI